MSKDDTGSKKYKFFVNDQKFEVAEQHLNGAQIRALARVDPSFQLFLEEPGPDKPDRKISDTESVDLDSPGIEKFYVVPPALFGAN